MTNLFTEKGIVLRSEPIGEYDRRLVILTKDSGKLSVFARGARRMGNPLMAASDLFVFGEFKIYAGSHSYTLSDATVINYFADFRSKLDCSLYGIYFLEVAEYLTRENNDEENILRLLYQTLRAVLSEHFDNRLVRGIFELKCMCLQGEFSYEESQGLLERYAPAVKTATEFIVRTSPDRLYNFGLKEDVLLQFTAFVKCYRDKLWNHTFNSEFML